MQKKIVQGLLAFSSLSLLACFDSGTPVADGAGANPGVNNSDPGKASYRAMTDAEKSRFDLKQQMLKKIDPQWADHLASPEAPALAKASASSTVGFLQSSGRTPVLDIFMDTENDGNADQFYKAGVSGNQLQLAGMDRKPQPDHNGGVMFHIKQVTMTSLPRLQYDYISFLFSDNCPANGYRFSEVFDNEDTQNQDYASGSVAPGWSNRDWTGTKLKFCFVPGTGAASTAYPPWKDGEGGGTIASPNKQFYSWTNPSYPFNTDNDCYETQEVWLDGEDDGFDGSIDFEQVPANYQANVTAMTEIRYGAPHFFINACRSYTVGTVPH